MMNSENPEGHSVQTAFQKAKVAKRNAVTASTNAERVQSWRVRLKQDPEAYSTFLLKERSRLRAYRSAQRLREKSREETEHVRKLGRARQQRYRRKLKEPMIKPIKLEKTELEDTNCITCQTSIKGLLRMKFKTPKGQPLWEASQKVKIVKQEVSTNAERAQSWRDRLKQNPDTYSTFLVKQRERMRAHRKAKKVIEKTREETEHGRKLGRARQQRYMQKKKLNEILAKTTKMLDMTKCEDRRMYNRLAQQKCRAKWSDQKRKMVNAKKRQSYKEKLKV